MTRKPDPHRSAPRDAATPGRRRFLQVTGQAAAACVAGGLVTQLGGCGGQEQPQEPASLRIALADLPDGARIRRELGGTPVQIERRGDQVIARSLLCTHQGCEVQWRPEDQEYFCPCHEGRFDADGRVIEGIPQEPLRTLPVTREADAVIIRKRPSAG